jgi:hypothetical protein
MTFDLRLKKVHHWKEHEILVLKCHRSFAFRFLLYSISTLEECGNIYNPLCRYVCRTRVKRSRRISIPVSHIIHTYVHTLL